MKALLYQHDAGHYAVATNAEAATFARNAPEWHRVGPVDMVYMQAAGEPLPSPTAALAELVRLKDMKDAIEDTTPDRYCGYEQVEASKAEMRSEYERAKPLAWAAARAALKEPPAWVRLSDEIEASPPQGESANKEDANNYCRILTLLGMEEEGDPVAEIERLLAAAAPAPPPDALKSDEPIPPLVYWAPLADNFYDAEGRGQGAEFYRKWKPRRAEFPQGESFGWGKGSAHNPFALPDALRLTDEQIYDLWTQSFKAVGGANYERFHWAARALESALAVQPKVRMDKSE